MCFLIGATGPGVTSTGEALIGGVSDDPYLFRTFVRAHYGPRAGKAACFAHLGSELRYVTEGPEAEAAGAVQLAPPFEVEPGQPSRAINEAGLAFTCALAIEREPTGFNGAPIPFASLSRRMMAECGTVDEAIALISTAAAVVPAFSVLLADAAGGLAQVEVGAYGVAVHRRYSKDNPGIIVAVNCYQSDSFCAFNKAEARLEQDENNNGVRLRRGWGMAEQRRGRLDVRGLAEILSDHANGDRECETNPLIKWWGHSICNHGTCGRAEYSAASPPWGTVSWEIMQPSKRAFHYCYGWPCGKAPEHGDQLFQVGSWGRFEAFVLPPSTVAESNATEAFQPEAEEAAKVVICTTVEGAILPEVEPFRFRPAVSAAGA
mmetsp:Transcript_28648/g.82880  ORF Transcript_28648/g.82880 Transcript_28648/m.82880 type:complete len:376 (+) Transcript_28648:33-1160(+)